MRMASASGRTLLAVPLLAVALLGCPDADDPAPAPSEPTGRASCDEGEACASTPPACNPSNCEGCCLGETCVSGGYPAGCGTKGAACEVCAEGASCNGGRCVRPCGPDTCAGCCSATGECLAGASDLTACGESGAACAPCGASEACVAGKCVAATCSATCNGCCKPDGSCVAYAATPGSSTSGATCGARGGTCVACADNASCEEGACRPNPGTAPACGGCWAADGTCTAGSDVVACGSAGMACDACGAFACVEDLDGAPVVHRACYLPTSQSYDVLLLDATFPSTDDDGDSWDPFGGLPDPKVHAGACDLAATALDPKNVPECLVADSAVVADTLGPSWGAAALFSGIDARHLRFLTFWLYDDDVALKDAVADCQLVLNPTDRDREMFRRYEKVLAGGVFEVACNSPKRKGVAKLRVRLRPH